MFLYCELSQWQLIAREIQLLCNVSLFAMACLIFLFSDLVCHKGITLFSILKLATENFFLK